MSGTFFPCGSRNIEEKQFKRSRRKRNGITTEQNAQPATGNPLKRYTRHPHSTKLPENHWPRRYLPLHLQIPHSQTRVEYGCVNTLLSLITAKRRLLNAGMILAKLVSPEKNIRGQTRDVTGENTPRTIMVWSVGKAVVASLASRPWQAAHVRFLTRQ